MTIREQVNAIWIFFCMSMTAAAVPPDVEITRIGDGPIIHSGLHPSIGENIQGPSVIRVPDWIEDPLGKYYLYFADHKGRYIRLAYANEMTGPWQSVRTMASARWVMGPEPPASASS